MLFSASFDANSPKHYRIASASFGHEFHVIEVGYNRPPKGLRQVMKRDIYILHYITSGRGTFCGEKIDNSYGYLVCPQQLEIIEADKVEPYESYWIMFQGTAVLEYLNKCGLKMQNGVFKFPYTKKCGEILHRAIFEITPQNEWEEIAQMHAAFYEILSLHLSVSNYLSNKESVPQKIREFIHKNYYNSISITEIADIFHFTRSYLFTLFKKEYGISPRAYLINLRIEKAKDLIRHERLFSVNEVSLAVGFRDPLYFSRVFHKKVGISPSEYIKKQSSK